MTNLKVDLHVVFAHNVGVFGGVSTGYVLIESGSTSPDPCLIQFDAVEYQILGVVKSGSYD